MNPRECHEAQRHQTDHDECDAQPLQTVGQWTMIRMGSYGIESLFQSRPLWEVWRPSLILSAMGLLLLGLGIRVIRKRFESGNVA